MCLLPSDSGHSFKYQNPAIDQAIMKLMKSKIAHSFIICLILTVGYFTQVQAVTDAELEALEKQIEQQEAEEKQQAETEAKRKADEKRKAEAEAEKKRFVELEKQRQEEKRKKEAEKKRLTELEQQRLEQEARKKAEEEKIEKYNSLIDKANQAMINKDKVLAISIYNKVLANYPDDAVAMSGIKEAEKFKHKVCYDVLGQWLYRGELSVDIKEGGIYDTPSVGQGSWKCTYPESRTIELQIPLATMTAVLSDDGHCLNATTWAGNAVFNRSGHVCEDVVKTKEQQNQVPFKL
jgi:chemotaxis protein histidine kinase CheA